MNLLRFLQSIWSDQSEPKLFDFTLKTETPFPLLWKMVCSERKPRKD